MPADDDRVFYITGRPDHGGASEGAVKSRPTALLGII